MKYITKKQILLCKKNDVNSILIDPGIGFGKCLRRFETSSTLARNFDETVSGELIALDTVAKEPPAS